MVRCNGSEGQAEDIGGGGSCCPPTDASIDYRGDRVSWARPEPVPGDEAGARCLGGWIAPNGAFYPAGYNEHIGVAEKLRATGDGPKDPWDVADPWLMVKNHGQ